MLCVFIICGHVYIFDSQDPPDMSVGLCIELGTSQEDPDSQDPPDMSVGLYIELGTGKEDPDIQDPPDM